MQPRIYALFVIAMMSWQSAANTIVWHRNHAPPSTILRGEHLHQGFIDQVLALLKEELELYQHKDKEAPLVDTIRALKDGHNLCYPSLIKRANRTAFVQFSQASVMHPTNFVVMANALAERLEIDDSVDLVKLLNHGDLFLGIRAGYSFGPYIDQLVGDHGFDSTMTFRSGQAFEDMYILLARGRIDYMVGYPFESFYALKKIGQEKNFSSYPIVGAPKFSLGSVGCTKNDWGAAVIADVNKALNKIKQTEPYRQALKSWLQQYVTDSDFNAYYQQQFLTN